MRDTLHDALTAHDAHFISEVKLRKLNQKYSYIFKTKSLNRDARYVRIQEIIRWIIIIIKFGIKQ